MLIYGCGYLSAVLSDFEEWPGSSFLAQLAPVPRRQLLDLGVERRYVRGEVVLQQGEPGRSVVVLLEGLTKVSALSVSGDELLLSLRTRGDLLGEMGFVTGFPRSAQVAAATAVRARLISELEFSGFLRRNPEQAMRVSAVLAHKLRRADERRPEYHPAVVEARVAAVLVDVADTAGRPADAGGISIGPELTQADLASLAMVPSPAFERQLQDFERDGLVQRRHRYLIITGNDRLREIAGHSC